MRSNIIQSQSLRQKIRQLKSQYQATKHNLNFILFWFTNVLLINLFFSRLFKSVCSESRENNAGVHTWTTF